MSPHGTSLFELRARAKEILEEVAINRLQTPESIYSRAMEESLLDASYILRRIDREDNIVRRPYSGLSTEAFLLSRLSTALRLRMNSHGNMNILGIADFNQRVDRFLLKASIAINADRDSYMLI